MKPLIKIFEKDFRCDGSWSGTDLIMTDQPSIRRLHVSTDQPSIHRRHVSRVPLSPSKQSLSREESSKRFTRGELKDDCRRNKTKNIAADSSRKRIAITVQTQQVAQHGVGNPTNASGQLRMLDDKVKTCARKYNEAKVQSDRLEKEVKSRSDEFAELELEATALHEMLEGNNSDAKKIASITEEIKEANYFAEEMLLYRHQLNYMYQRLGDNSVSLDGQIGELSATLSSAQKERSRCQNVLAEIESSLFRASAELDETVKSLQIVDCERNRELSRKQQETANAERMEKWNIDRVNSNVAMHESLVDENRAERDRLQRTVRERRSQLRALNKLIDENLPKLASLEDTLTQIEHATGLISITEMVHKMRNYDEYQLRLTKEKMDAEERLKGAKLTFAKDEDSLAHLKTQGLSTTELNREILDDIKASISAEKSGGKIVKSTNKRLENLLIGLRQGGIGLYNRLLPFHSSLLNEEAPVLGEMDSTNAVQAASDTMEMINFTEKVLGKMLLEIGGIRFVDSRIGTGKEVASPESPTEMMNCRVTPKVRRIFSSSTFESFINYINNLWCPLKKETDEDGADNDSTVDSVDDVPTRSNLKTTSQKHTETQMLEERKKKKKRIKKKSPSAQKDSDHDDIIVDSESQHVTPNVKNLSSPSKRQTGIKPREDTSDRVQAFLTEVPSLE